MRRCFSPRLEARGNGTGIAPVAFGLAQPNESGTPRSFRGTPRSGKRKAECDVLTAALQAAAGFGADLAGDSPTAAAAGGTGRVVPNQRSFNRRK